MSIVAVLGNILQSGSHLQICLVPTMYILTSGLPTQCHTVSWYYATNISSTNIISSVCEKRKMCVMFRG